MDEAVDNIEAQLDMAVEAADDIGFDDEEVVDNGNTEETTPESTTEEATFDEAPSGSASRSSEGTGEVSGSQPLQKEVRSDQNSDPVATGQNTEGDLVNAAGEVVATRGAERRVYERSNKVQQENAELTRKMGEMQHTFDDQNSFANQPGKLGLSSDEAGIGMQLMQQLKTDPVAAARQILQTAVSKGYNIQDIIGTAHGQQSPVNMGAIEQMISEKLAPITQREEAARVEQQRVEQVERGKREFISTHEYSDIHLEPITNLLQNNPNMSPDQAYYEVKTYAMGNNLDFTQPLGPQVQALKVEADPQYTNQRQPNRAMPNGNSSNSVITQNPAQASGDDDWDAIVRNSMAESGMQV